MARLDANLNRVEFKQRNKLQDNSRIYLAEVMDTRSPTKFGDIYVWVVNSGTDKTKPSNWIIAKNSSTCFGTTLNTAQTNSTAYNTQPTSFGWWNPMPYVGNYVFIFFPCTIGENSNAYWFGSPMKQNNMMLPGIPYNLDQSKDYSPKCEVNYKNTTITAQNDYTVLKNNLQIQGLNNDRLRGISTSSAYRDTPSHCYGFLSPLGNQMVIDDGWSLGDNNINWVNDPRKNDNDNIGKDDNGQYHSKKNWIASLETTDKENKLNRFHGGFRFRTRNGTQLLILDAGNIYMINKDGSAWVELTEDGYIDCYSAFGINASSEGDINLHAKNINIEATDKITLSSGKATIIHTPSNVDITSASVNISTNLTTPKLVASNGSITSFSSSAANIVGVFSGTLQGTAYYSTYAGMVPTEQPLPDINTETVVTPESPTYYDVEQQFDETLTSINSRVPTHEPWDGHDRNDSIPTLVVKQVIKKEEETVKENNVTSNQIRN